MRVITRTVFVGLLLLLGISAPHADDAVTNPVPSWIESVQTYSMLPLTPEEAAEFNVSVNGVWAGFGGGSPILPFPPFISSVGEEFGDDMNAFADACHKAGLKVVCGINGVEGMKGIRAQIPNAEELMCLDADGRPVLWGNPDEECYIMCNNNPKWVEFEIEYGKRGIDAGADFVLVDTPQGPAMAAVLRAAGFCPSCMENFHQFLNAKFTPEQLKEKFGITEFRSDEIISRLRAPKEPQGDEMLFINRAKNNPLFYEFMLCQEKAGFDTRKELIDTLREYAMKQGRQVVFSANAFLMGRGNPFGYWIRATMFADVFDLFAYENSYAFDGSPFQDVPMPRGKWASIHKLAYSVYKRRSPAVVPAGSMGKIFAAIAKGGKPPSMLMGVEAAESYAANGAYIMYYFEAPPGDTSWKEKLWSKSIEVGGFVQDHSDLYDGEARSGSPAAFVFLDNDRGRTIPSVFPSYLGLTQGFIEGNYPFDVIYAGDGQYVKDRFSAKELEGYTALIIPSPIAPTENQKKVIQEFVKAGGAVVVQEPDRLGIEPGSSPMDSPEQTFLEKSFKYGQGSVLQLKGVVTDTWTDDIGSRFFRDYDVENRHEIYALAKMLGILPVSVGEGDGLVCAYPLVQPEKNRVIVHLVNYDLDNENNVLREKADLVVKLPRPAFLTGDIKAILYSIGAEQAEVLPIEATESMLSCNVSKLVLGATIVFSVE